MTNKYLPDGLTPAGRLIVALDFNTAEEANELIEKLGGVVNFYKVGWQLFLGEGWPFVKSLLEKGKKVFLDLKINDIEQTVQAALANIPNDFAGKLELLTIHGNAATVRAAKKSRKDKPYLLMLTVLSSLDDSDMKDSYSAGNGVDTTTLAKRRAQDALAAGCEGLIASGAAVKALREDFREHEFLIVTPGVRPRGAEHDDHKRTLTPYEAIAHGSDYLVVGRPVTRAAEPLAAAKAIIDEIEAALPAR